MHVLRCTKLQMSFCQVQHNLLFLNDCSQSKHYHALFSLASSIASTFVNVANAHVWNTLYTVLAVCAAPRLGRKWESHWLIHSLMSEQWSSFRKTQTCCGHVSDTWNVCLIFLWCVLWNNNEWQTCKIIQLMVIHGKSTLVEVVAFSIRRHTLILNLMYDTNMHLLKMLYDIW